MATIKDIARITRLDISTVSRALNDSRRVKDSTKRRVRQAAERLGYQTNEVARSLVTKRTRVIGLIVSDIGNPFFAEVTKGVEYEGMRRGYSTILCSSDWDARRELDYVRVLRSKQVDGLIVHPSGRLPGAALRDLLGGETPVVFLGNGVRGGGAYTISIDNVKGAFCVTSYLISLGHRRIAHITGDISRTQRGYRILDDRLSGYRRALESAGIEFRRDFVLETGPTSQSVCEVVKRFLLGRAGVTAVFATSDVAAMGVYKAVHELGLRIPQDISVVGFDNVEVASILKPGLTTYEQPRSVQGRLAVTVLVRIIEGRPPTKRGFIVKTRGMVIRESCARRGSGRGRGADRTHGERRG